MIPNLLIDPILISLVAMLLTSLAIILVDVADVVKWRSGVLVMLTSIVLVALYGTIFLVEQNFLTRKYELGQSGRELMGTVGLSGLPTLLSKINTPSYAHGTRRIEDKTRRGAFLEVVESYSASFYPRRGLVRVDESKPNVKAALKALLNPIYRSIRRTTITDFEIEINLKAKGTIQAGPTKDERTLEEWREKMKILEAEERRKPW